MILQYHTSENRITRYNTDTNTATYVYNDGNPIPMSKLQQRLPVGTILEGPTGSQYEIVAQSAADLYHAKHIGSIRTYTWPRDYIDGYLTVVSKPTADPVGIRQADINIVISSLGTVPVPQVSNSSSGKLFYIDENTEWWNTPDEKTKPDLIPDTQPEVRCKHEYVEKYLLTSTYWACKHCGQEENR